MKTLLAIILVLFLSSACAQEDGIIRIELLKEQENQEEMDFAMTKDTSTVQIDNFHNL